jgi:hypothetical protein
LLEAGEENNNVRLLMIGDAHYPEPLPLIPYPYPYP